MEDSPSISLQTGLELMDAVATGATDESLAVDGSLEVRVLANVARQALLLHLFRCCLCELKDLGSNPTAFNVGSTGAVTAFACHAFAAMLECQLGMRILVEAVYLSLMTQSAGFCAGIV